METAARRASFAGMFSSAIVTQALLSAANLLVSLILIRRASDSQYGYFVLIGGFLDKAIKMPNNWIMAVTTK